MDKWVILILVFIFIFSFIPQRGDYYYPLSKDMLIVRIFVNLIYCIIGFFVYLIFFVHENTLIFTLVYAFVFVLLIIVEHYVFVYVFQRNIRKKILTIPNFMNMTEGQIRNELLEKYDKVYDIKNLKSVLKKMGYYD